MNKNRIFLLFNFFVLIMFSSSLFGAQTTTQQPKEEKITIPEGGVFLVKDEHPLHTAIKDGDLKQVEALIKKNSVLLYTVDKEGNTPLHVAVESGNKEVVIALLSKYEQYNLTGLKTRATEYLRKLNKNEQSAAALAKQRYETTTDIPTYSTFFEIAALINASISFVINKKTSH